MRHSSAFLIMAALGSFLTACSGDTTAPFGPQDSESIQSAGWGPETPHFNLQVILRGDGFGHVKFRQPNDADFIIYLNIWVRDLTPNTSYVLQRAVDLTVDDICTSQGWLPLGKGLVPQAITTDDKGTGREELFRDVSAFPAGSEFDIHFRVIDQATNAVVLQSECYQFTISQ